MMPTMPARGSENERSSISRRSPKPLRSPVDLDDGVAEPGARWDGDLEALVVAAVGLGLGLQLVVRGEAGLALRLAGLRRHAHPLQLALERAAPRLVAALLTGEALLLLLEPRRVVALEREPPAAVQLEDPLRHVVEEVAVVRDRHDRARVLLEELLEPVDALGVEVVRRLVEQQQVGSAEQQPAQGDAAPLTARQRRDVGVVGWAAQRVHGDLDVALEAPRVGRGDLVLQLGLQRADLVVVGVGLGPHRHDLVVAVDDRLHRGDAVHDVAPDVLGRIELGLLGEVAGGEPGREASRAAEAVVEAGHDLEQARLAGAVGADDPDLGARVERDRDVLQHRAVGRVEAGQLVAGVDELVRHDGGRGYRQGGTRVPGVPRGPLDRQRRAVSRRRRHLGRRHRRRVAAGARRRGQPLPA